MKALWITIALILFYLNRIHTQVAITSPTLSASGGIVQETGTLAISFALNPIVLSTGDTITLDFPTGVSMVSPTPTCTQIFGFTLSS